MTTKKETTAYLLAFIHGLKQSGLKEIVISPGSRSTPLALLVYRDPKIKCYVNVDERSAAFFALGLAKGTGEPVGLLCTSGTAAANYYPAICEAEATQVPLVVLTADRPPESLGVGAPQTMNQNSLYGSHVKKYLGMAVPEAGETFERYSFWHGCEIVSIAKKSPKGPVHINFPFREPLLPDLTQSFSRTYSRKEIEPEKNGDLEVPELSSWLTKKGLIIVGKELTIAQAQQLLELSELLGWPIIGDPLSNLSSCAKISDNYLAHTDLVFSANQLASPEVIWQFGNLPLSKNLMLYLKKQEVSYVLIDERAQWKDWLHLGNYFLTIDPMTFCKIIKSAKKCLPHATCDKNWLIYWQEKSKRAHQVIESILTPTTFNESNVSKRLFDLLKQNETLFLSNSNAIRFVDRLAEPAKQAFSIYGNRGVNGIDGIISTAAGVSMSKKHHLFLLIGDLALFHDMNGLQIVKELELSITIVVLNNNGGGIFSFLPQSELETSLFEPLFSTPLNLELKKVADLYHGSYKKPRSMGEFEDMIHQSRESSTWTLIEISGTQKEPVDCWYKMVKEFGNSYD
ncbi:2-succinyl-5-enolpyruvyl-6-hydroxy-3-cyclohexene-1-carboxylic-acid synthase [Enterococcus villorum]|uniref:2-succinyl-5-enolpyruvyl-6-hydroxy-3-cyclohexene-1-carboxylate synthase n=1 Tax=Enterococcus villorum TaxID=112904 RepID=A0A1V8YFQ3_9ENTE|nr:2-succinyl-5-enolpyruvyl-6-hydroxy-3-cyclohexene-1-carboxylic-acid synthase [Enterococcus villorum]OQO71467.1 2-succinyl-5-enolpyruvyl-6-hydroxy-3-cyclohexene-1-carboxylic-acid synthase [Enterococcus villorum]OQO76642.1 2-succinyl-5-enolpyruvyl-6-hydroxy-3-cyclohexene-1-carboxylic-acid synthase [Enterococcus villorum]